MKKIIYLSVIALLFIAQQGFSQCTGVLPATNDLIARPSLLTCAALTTPINSVINTGYDMYYDANPLILRNDQVMVWDGPNGSFAWDWNTPFGNFVNSIQFTAITQIGTAPRTLLDPDVVVMTAGTDTFAMVVGIAQTATGANNGRVFWISYVWNANTFAFNASGFLGTNTGLGCSNPNIDVNACGAVALTWAWQRNENITFTTTGTNYNIGPVVQSVLRSDIYGAFGRIDAPLCAAPKGLVTATGDLISTVTAIDHLFEKNITPDVSISDRTGGSCANYHITFTWQTTWFDPATFLFNSRVAVKQHTYDFNAGGCVTAGGPNGYYRLLDFSNLGGRPRIASRPTSGTAITHYTDFQVVMAYTNIGCSVNYTGCPSPATCTISSSSAVYNWGRHNSTDLNATLIPNNLAIATSLACNLTSFYNNNGVVSYVNTAFNTLGDYVVAWEHGPSPSACAQGISNTTSIDIVARTYNNGVNTAAATTFSIVNRNTCNANRQLGNQLIPSIGGRHARTQMGFDFWDQMTAAHFYIGYKASVINILPGTGTALRVVNPGTPDLEEGTFERVFNVSPNPFSNEVTFFYNLPENERVLGIEIFDTQGHLVRQISLDSKSTQETIHLDVPSGIYITKLKTSNGEMISKITRTE